MGSFAILLVHQVTNIELNIGEGDCRTLTEVLDVVYYDDGGDDGSVMDNHYLQLLDDEDDQLRLRCCHEMLHWYWKEFWKDKEYIL